MGQDAIEHVVGSRIDSHTIKWGAQSSKHCYLVPLGVDLHAFALELMKCE